jgi:hypothetical protein
MNVGYSKDELLKGWRNFRKTAELQDYETYLKNTIIDTALLKHNILLVKYSINESIRIGDAFLGKDIAIVAWSKIHDYDKRKLFTACVLNAVMNY